jgi:aspartate--ammonia ligase
MRAADYDDWCTPTIQGPDGEQYHGLNGDILMWNPVTKRRHELSSMGIRVTKETLVQQLTETKQEHFLQLPYHKMILADQIPQSIGGGIGQSRTYQYLLGKAALGECSVTIWPHQLHEACAAKGIHLLR